VSESRSGGHQQLVERLQAFVSERYGASGAPTAEVTLSNVRETTKQADYMVTIYNPTDINYRVVIGWRTSDSPEGQATGEDLPANGGQVGFHLTSPGQCASLQGYVMVFVVGNDIQFWSPPDAETGGEWNAKRVSEEYPADQDPCVDRWTL
jgi:hypothetical protein